MKKQQLLNDDSILALFENLPDVEELRQNAAANAATDWEGDPEFVAAYLKREMIEDILAAMEEQGLSKSDVAAKLGKSRQYVSRVLAEHTNFTLETVAEFACALDRRVAVRLFARDQRMVLAARQPAALVREVEEGKTRKAKAVRAPRPKAAAPAKATPRSTISG